MNYLHIKIILPCEQLDPTPWGVNPTKTSPIYKYAITSKSRWMSKAQLPFGSSSSLWEFPLPVLP